MKKSLLLSLAFAAFSLGASANCERFPTTDGPVQLRTQLAGREVTVVAQFRKTTAPEYGNPNRLLVSHTYAKPEFYLDGTRVDVTREAAAEVFRALGYAHVEYAVLKTPGLFSRRKVLTAELELVSPRAVTTLVDAEGFVAPFDAQCSDWVY